MPIERLEREPRESRAAGRPSDMASATATQTFPPEKRWYAVYTRAQHQKQVALQLERQALQCFLPLYASVRRWKDRRVVLNLPLFPSYVFVHLGFGDRLSVQRTPGVVNLVGFGGVPCPIPDSEIEALQACVGCKVRMQPHPYLRVGRRVAVKTGPLTGLEGILVRHRKSSRLVLSIDSIRSSVWVELDAVDVEPVPASRRTTRTPVTGPGRSLDRIAASS